MSPYSDIVDACTRIFNERGKDALDRARAEMLTLASSRCGSVSSAVKYFSRVTLKKALPVFPALMSLSCEAVGGTKEKTTGFGAALLLYAFAADIHDDIIDRSDCKYSRKTVYGKFGPELSLLTGNALLVLGTNLLHSECENLLERDKRKILQLTTEAFLEISKAEAKEIGLRGRLNVSANAHFEIIGLKASVPRVNCEIGAILGNGDNAENQALVNFGRTIGIISLVIEEFADLLDYEELKRRVQNESPPLPLLLALRNISERNSCIQVLRKAVFSQESLKEVAKVTLESPEVKRLTEQMEKRVSVQINEILPIVKKKIKEEIATLLLAQLHVLKDLSQ